MLLLLSNTYTRTKFSRVTMNSQNQEPPLNASTTVPHCCQQLFLSISSYTKKNSSQKVCNRYILSFQTKVGNRSIYDNKVSCFISSFYCFCCVPILCWKSWSFLLVVEHHSVMCHPFHHFIKEICILVCWAILWSFSWAKYFFVWRENGVGTHFEQQFFSFTQH